MLELTRAIGIDLGTTYSCVAVWEGERVEVIANDLGDRLTPSCVSFVDEKRLVGKPAAEQATRNPTTTLRNIKRLIGRAFNDKQVQEDIKKWPFKVIDRQGQPVVEFKFKNQQRRLAPEQVSAAVLEYMKTTAEHYIQAPITDCVITVPAYFNNGQRQATKDAATIAGLKVLQIINEPTAAAIAYGVNKQNYDQKHDDHHVLVFDFGGGTFDISILNIDQGVFTVKATGGDTNLGGEDINDAMVEYFCKEIQALIGNDIHGDERRIPRLRAQCEKVKRELSFATQSQIDMDDFFGFDQHYCPVLTRATFNSICHDIFESLMEILNKTLKDADMERHEIDEILLVGGSTKIPRIRELITEFFEKAPNKSVNPDEIVACGAAIQAASLSGNLNKSNGLGLVLHDVTPFSLGVQAYGNVMSRIIERNSPIPAEEFQLYCSVEDNQTSVVVNIYQGERLVADENNYLGTMSLDGIPPALRGRAKVEILFRLDYNGILGVKTKCLTTDKFKEIQLKTGRLPHSKIKRMIATAAKFRQMDEEFMKRTMARQNYESCLYNMRNYLESSDNSYTFRFTVELSHTIEKALAWIAEHPNAKTQDYELHQKNFMAATK